MERKKTFTELSEKYSLTDIDLTRLETEFEITQLKLEFAILKSKTEGISLFESIEKYNAFHRYTEKLDQKEKDSLIKQIKSIDSSRLSDLVELLFLNSDRTKGICTHQMDPCALTIIFGKMKGLSSIFLMRLYQEIPSQKEKSRIGKTN